ncbi:MAG: helix-turn-helix transcriptional regulator [Sphingomonadaceae bacterium]|nr:helix-turn-helix transcriptional regulator [Sphingomonadaceae bacterium]
MARKRRTPADEPHLIVRSLASSFEAGARTGRHLHAWHQLIYASSGVLTIWTERGSWITPPQRAVFVPAGVAHEIGFAAKSALRTLYLRPEWSGALPADCAVITVSPLLRELILRATQDGMLDGREPIDAALAALIVDEFRQARVPPFELPQPESPRLRRAAELIAGDVATGTGDAARGAGMSKRALERAFRAETGMSPGHWRRQRALLAAIERLAGGAPIKQVAADAGYATPSAFTAAFRKQFGVTPGRYFAAA